MLTEYRCKKCNKLLLKVEDNVKVKIEVKCSRCKKINLFDNKK